MTARRRRWGSGLAGEHYGISQQKVCSPLAAICAWITIKGKRWELNGLLRWALTMCQAKRAWSATALGEINIQMQWQYR